MGKSWENHGKSTIFHGQINLKWPFSVALLVYQRVSVPSGVKHGVLENHGKSTIHDFH
jgi:hypothetical protein